MVETYPDGAPPPTQAPPLQQPLPTMVPRAAPPAYPPLEQLPHLQFCIHSNPSLLQTFLFAFQHYIVMLGSIVIISTYLVPLMGGNNGDKARVIQTLLFMSGVNTLLQTVIGTRLPTVMNASFAFVIPVLSTISDFNDRNYDNEHQRFVHTIRAIQGSMIVSSLVNILIGYSKLWGNCSRFFSPLIMVPVVCVVGLGLFERGFPQLAKCVEIGLPMLILLIILQQYVKHVNERFHLLFERFGLLLCIVVVWSFAAVLTAAGAYHSVSEKTKQHCRTDSSYLISSAPWIRMPYPFQWGAPIFSASHVFGMMGATLVSAIESTGTHFATARLAGATPPPAHVITRSIGLQGVGMLLEGIFGAAVGSAASVENAGLLGLTRIGSRRAVQISTGFMIFFSIFGTIYPPHQMRIKRRPWSVCEIHASFLSFAGKFGAFFASIPLPVFAAIYCVLFGLVAAIGISFIQFTNHNSLRNLYVLGLSLFLGISIPQYFNEFTASAAHGPVKTNAGWFNDILNSLFSSAPTVAMLVATLLDNTLQAVNTAAERGLPWWVPFQNRKGDLRNDEFYSYPMRIHSFMPTRYL